MEEIWKDIAGYEGLYQVSNLGNVKSLNYNHTGKPKKLAFKRHKSGYLTVMLCKDGKNKNRSIQTLVANSFIENPDCKPCVNHIDGNKENNTVGNLEWVTYSENTRHAIEIGLRGDGRFMSGRTGALNPLSKHVNQFTKDGEFVKEWDCISDVARHFGCNPCTIVNCCAGRIKSCKGYVWRYAEA